VRPELFHGHEHEDDDDGVCPSEKCHTTNYP
jgi:hypothetical protein